MIARRMLLARLFVLFFYAAVNRASTDSDCQFDANQEPGCGWFSVFSLKESEEFLAFLLWHEWFHAVDVLVVD